MSKESALEKFTSAKQAIIDHIEQNKSVFEAHERLVGRLIDAENDLRDAVAEAGKGVSNADYTVTCTPQTQEVWDEQKTCEALRVSKEGAIAAGLLMVNKRPHRISITSTVKPSDANKI